jgi:hypothetical protein
MSAISNLNATSDSQALGSPEKALSVASDIGVDCIGFE